MGADHSVFTVMVFDDHPIWRDAVARDLAEEGFTVVATADGVGSARRRAAVVKPDVVVMDMRLSDGSGAGATAEVLTVSPSSRILVLSASDERDDVLEAVKAGATGYLVKSASKGELADAVRATAEGRAVFTPGLAGLVLGEYRRMARTPGGGSTPSLTARETEILRYVAKGLIAQPFTPQPAAPAPSQPPAPQPPAPRSDGWIGKALAVAGVAVTLVGVALLLVLAAQAGILRPEFRIGAGAVLAAGLVGAGWWLNKRPGGRVGAIALAATGIAAAYIDVIALTTIYDWVSAPVGLAIAAFVAVAGLMMARQWDSEHLGLLVLVPLIGLAPVVAGGVTLLLVGFMLALSAASLPIQLGKDWIGMHAARVAAGTLPLLVALAALNSSSKHSVWLAIACSAGAVLAIGGALILLRHTRTSVAMALLSAAGTLPVLAASLAVGRVASALMAAVLAAALLAIVLIGGRLPMVTAPVRVIWSALAAVSALIAVAVAFDGPVAGPVLLAMAVVVAVAGRRSQVARWCAVGFGVVGGLFYLAYAPLSTLVIATVLRTPIAVSTLVASLLLVACAIAIAWSWPSDWSWATAAVIGLYALTMFTVTAGVLLGGEVQGFFAGHMAATICWIALAAAVFRYAAKAPRVKRSLPIGGGVALVAAAMAKLFLFDLGTLDGIFRVVVFIVVGLALLGMGAGYARLLAQQDDQDQQV